MLCLRSPEDQAGAFITLRASGQAANPAHSSEWIQNQALMYAAWAKHRDFQVTLLNEMSAVGNLTEVTLNIAGFGAYALLKGDTGSHRLVRAGAGKRNRGLPQKALAQER